LCFVLWSRWRTPIGAGPRSGPAPATRPGSTLGSAIVIRSASEDSETWTRVSQLYPEVPVTSYEVVPLQTGGRSYRVFHLPTREGWREVYFDITDRLDAASRQRATSRAP
jgi:hypothetical protein